MSKGYGMRERAILEAIQRKGGWLYLRDILPKQYTKAEYNALHRAAFNLANKRKIGCLHWLVGVTRVAVGPAGTNCKREERSTELSVDNVTS